MNTKHDDHYCIRSNLNVYALPKHCRHTISKGIAGTFRTVHVQIPSLAIRIALAPHKFFINIRSKANNALGYEFVLPIASAVVMYEALAYLEIEHGMKFRVGIEDQSNGASLDVMP